MDLKCFFTNIKKLITNAVTEIRNLDPPLDQFPVWTVIDVSNVPVLLPPTPLKTRRYLRIQNSGSEIIRITNSSGSGGWTLKPGHVRRYRVKGDNIKFYAICETGGGECETEET